MTSKSHEVLSTVLVSSVQSGTSRSKKYLKTVIFSEIQFAVICCEHCRDCIIIDLSRQRLNKVLRRLCDRNIENICIF